MTLISARDASTDTRPRVLFLDTIKLAKPDAKAFEKIADVVHVTSTSRDEFLQDLRTKYSDIVGIYRHFKASASITITGRFDSELVDQLPSTLKYICHNGAGYDQIDIDACTKRGIQVSNVPTAVDGATADTALFLLLSVLRQFPLALEHAKAGTFNSKVPLSHDPAGKLLGIVGMGGIGSAFAKRALALGMRVQYYNRRQLSAEDESAMGVTYASSLEELLATSDVVSLNLPLNAATKHLMSDKQFGMMKSSAVLINTARGPVVDEAALVRALESGTIAGAGLDVYEDEPRITPALLASDKAVCLPHIGTVSVETQTEMEAVCLRNLAHGLQQGRLGFVVAEQKALLE